MKQITVILAGAALSCYITSGLTHAASIQTLTIEEIGVTSAGLGTSAIYADGGFGDWIPSSGVYTPAPAFFVSAGSADGAMVMGTTQGNGGFTLGASWFGQSVLLNTLQGVPSGSISQGVMTLDLSGLLAELPDIDLTFKVAPDAGTLLTSVWAIDAARYYYTADWTQFIDGNGDVYHTSSGIWATGWEGSTVAMHLEGIATLAPVPEAETYAMMLAGLGLVGFMARRRRKSA